MEPADPPTKETKPSRAVLTLALGKRLYAEMAYNLARSFLWWHRNNDIQFYLATDDTAPLPPDLAKIQRILLQPGQYGEGFSPKLSLDLIAPAARTLFIDADCLCVGRLDSVFAQLAGRTVGVIGGSIAEGEWFGEVAPLCRRLGVPSLPKFNGGIYYLEPGPAAREVYSQARELETRYDALGLVRLRGRPNDELLMAMAMASHGLAALPDDGTILSSPYECPGPFSLDVLRGRSSLLNPPAPHPDHRAWYPFTRVHPTVVHFLDGFNRSYQYRAEAVRLRFWASGGMVRAVVWCWSLLAVAWPGQLRERLKAGLRPLYRLVFGYRTLRRSERL